MNKNIPIDSLETNVGLGIETPLTNTVEEPVLPEIAYSGDIGIEELSPELQELIIRGITSGSGGGGSGTGGDVIQIGGNVTLKSEVKSVIVETDRQKEFIIPMDNYKQDVHHFELRLGSAWFSPTRYTIVGNKVVLNEDEVGIALGRRLDFVFCYIENSQGESSASLNGSHIADGTITKVKLSAELQAQIDGHDTEIDAVENSVATVGQSLETLKQNVSTMEQNIATVGQSVETVKQNVTGLTSKLDGSVKDIESSNNFNSVRVVKNDGTTIDVPIKILGGSSGSSLNVFKTAELGGSFTATQETNSFVINELTEKMDVSLVFKNLILVKGVDFTVNKESKTVVLNFNLKAEQTIYYILTGTSFSYNDLDGAPNVGDTNSLSTTSKEVVGAINEIGGKLPTDEQKQAWTNKADAVHEHPSLDMKNSDSAIRIGTYYKNYTGLYGGNGDGASIGTVEDNLSTGVANLVLQSWYGIGFANSCPSSGARGINIAMNVRDGSITTRGDVVASGASLVKGLGHKGNYMGNIDELFSSGVYKLVSPFSGTMPSNQTVGTAQHSIMLVFGDNGSGGSIVQELFTTNHTAYGAYANRQYKRIRFGGNWSAWVEIGSKDKNFFSCTAGTGISIVTQECYELNGEVAHTLRVKKTDGTNFSAGATYVLASSAYTLRNTVIGAGMGMKQGGNKWDVPITAFYQTSNKTIYALATIDCAEIYLTVRGVLS